MAILKFWIFRQNSEFGHLRSIFSSEGHIWTVRTIFSSKKSIYGSYGPYVSGRKSIYGPYGPYISCGTSIYGPSVSPFVGTLLTGARPFFSCFPSPYFINRGGLLTGGMGYYPLGRTSHWQRTSHSRLLQHICPA